jgi:hypothetical protein
VLPARFGRIPDKSTVIRVHAAGFPLWKLRKEPGVFRDLHDAVGWLAVLSNRRSGMLEVTVQPPASDPDEARSPWEGMSGAAVWAAGRIVGVVARHYRREGGGRLTAVRLDRCLERAGNDGRLTALLGMTGHEKMADVARQPSALLASSGYREQVRDIAPADGLSGREAELDELTAFCAGDEPYLWWQAGPWAGKTALLSWFVLHPPPGVEVVSFFITARLAAQADSNAFTDAMIEQLSLLTGQGPAPQALTSFSRESLRRGLLSCWRAVSPTRTTSSGPSDT